MERSDLHDRQTIDGHRFAVGALTRVPAFGAAAHFFEQYFTCSQLASHFFRHENGRLQHAHGFDGRCWFGMRFLIAHGADGQVYLRGRGCQPGMTLPLDRSESQPDRVCLVCSGDFSIWIRL